jgi:hypothetical protein
VIERLIQRFVNLAIDRVIGHSPAEIAIRESRNGIAESRIAQSPMN